MRRFAKKLGWRARRRGARPWTVDGPWILVTHDGTQAFDTFHDVDHEVLMPIVGAWLTTYVAEQVAMIMDAPGHPYHDAVWAWAHGDQRRYMTPMLELVTPLSRELSGGFPMIWTDDELDRLDIDFEILGRLLRAVMRKRAVNCAADLARAMVKAPGPMRSRPRL